MLGSPKAHLRSPLARQAIRFCPSAVAGSNWENASRKTRASSFEEAHRLEPDPAVDHAVAVDAELRPCAPGAEELDPRAGAERVRGLAAEEEDRVSVRADERGVVGVEVELEERHRARRRS